MLSGGRSAQSGSLSGIRPRLALLTSESVLGVKASCIA
jgi:hypothetical protein